MVLRTGFNKVLDKCLRYEDNVLEPFDFRQVVYELVHLAFRFGQLRRAVFLPELIVTHHGIDVLYLVTLPFEDTFRYFIKAKIGITCGTSYLERTEQFLQVGKFAEHVIFRQHPFARRKFGKHLIDNHVVDEVDIALLRQIHDTFLHSIGRIGQYV